MTEPIDFTRHVPLLRSDVDRALDAVFHERDEAIRQLHNANRINNDLTEAITKVSRENTKLRAERYPAATADEVSAAIQRINDVVIAQCELLQGTGSLARAADIRRRQVAKGYTVEHDREHGSPGMIRAALALAGGDSRQWPWLPNQYARLKQDPDRFVHAAALLLAAQDVIDAIRSDDREDN